MNLLQLIGKIELMEALDSPDPKNPKFTQSQSQDYKTCTDAQKTDPHDIVFVDYLHNNDDNAFVRSNLDTHLSDTPYTIQQPIQRPRLLERVYKPICTLHWCGDLQSFATESIRDRV